MPSIFRKSAKGVSEIDTRAHRLVPRLRGMLILVDGKRSDEELARLMPQHAAETLAALLAQGFVEVDTTSPPAAAPKPALAPIPPTQTASFEAVRRSMVRALNDTIGPAAETLALRMERTQTAEDLRLLLPMAVQTITHMRGRPAAEAFAARFDAL
jgi:hypothetical protein